MQKISVQSDLTLAFDELTEEIDQIIASEVNTLFSDLREKGRDVHDTWHFFQNIKAPRKIKDGWRIILKAKYSSILWAGRDETLKQGSKNWYFGGEPMLKAMGNKIRRKTDAISK